MYTYTKDRRFGTILSGVQGGWIEVISQNLAHAHKLSIQVIQLFAHAALSADQFA